MWYKCPVCNLSAGFGQIGPPPEWPRFDYMLFVTNSSSFGQDRELWMRFVTYKGLTEGAQEVKPVHYGCFRASAEEWVEGWLSFYEGRRQVDQFRKAVILGLFQIPITGAATGVSMAIDELSDCSTALSDITHQDPAARCYVGRDYVEISAPRFRGLSHFRWYRVSIR